MTINTPVIYTILEGNTKGFMSAKTPTTIVASARTVPRISPTARESSFLLTDFSENSNSGIVAPSPIINIPMIIGVIPKFEARCVVEVTAKCEPRISIAMLAISK